MSLAIGMRSEPIMPHYVNVASGSFLWRGFLLCGVSYAKTMTEKTDCNTEEGLGEAGLWCVGFQALALSSAPAAL